MKKLLALIFSAALLFCACRDASPAGTTVTEEFDGIKITISVPDGWSYLPVRSDEIFELQHQGIQLFDGDIPEQHEMYDGEIFVAVAASGHAESYIDSLKELSENEPTEEKLTTSAGYNLKIIKTNGLPEYAVFEDIPEMCIFFDVDKSSETVAYNVINTIKIEKE